ncbi:MAG: PrsW family intramembrane metalloprotease [Anaerolineae bacterium]|nr:PrsW family intramembrane metalloprotease [Anaerolineae bacterium]
MLKFLRVAVLVVALLIVAFGLVVGCLGIILSLLNVDADRLLGITGSVAVLVLAVGLGLTLAWQALQAVRGRGSNPFHPRRVWPLGLVFLLALALGQAVLSLDLLPVLTFPPAHIAVAIMPSVIVLGLAGRSLAGLTRWRDMVLQASSGAFLATAISFVLEIAVGLGLIAVVSVVLAIQPEGQQVLESLADRLRSPTGLEDPAFLSSLAQSPIVVGVALLVLAVVVPLIEEATKTLGIALAAYRRPTMAQAFLWGLAGGAGFALAESLLNTLGGLEGWIVAMLSRIGATMLHCFVGGLMGLGWYYVLAEQRWARGLALYAASVSLHGVWNALAGGLTFLSLRVESAETIGATQAWAGLAMFAILALLVILAVAITAGLVLLTRRVRLWSTARA